MTLSFEEIFFTNLLIFVVCGSLFAEVSNFFFKLIVVQFLLNDNFFKSLYMITSTISIASFHNFRIIMIVSLRLVVF